LRFGFAAKRQNEGATAMTVLTMWPFRSAMRDSDRANASNAQHPPARPKTNSTEGTPPMYGGNPAERNRKKTC
jgi:hypothetical protein